MRCSALAIAILLVALPAGLQAQTPPAPPPATPSVNELLDQAAAALQRQDFNTALQLTSQAVDRDPDSLEARLRRLGLLEMAQGAGSTEELNRWLKDALLDDLRAISRLAPDSRQGGIARDALARVEGRKLFDDPPSTCSQEAVAAMSEAERQLASRRYRESLPHYRKAVELCPGDPVYWIHYADAHFVLGEFKEATPLFQKGLALAPWYGPGHRFLADNLAKSGDWEGGYHEAVLAVLSDPTYEAGWETLKDFIVGRHGTWLRAYGDKPEVKTKGSDGKPGVNLVLPADLKNESPGAVTWMLYGLAKSAALVPPAPAEPGKPAPKPVPRTPLEIEKEAVLAALGSHREAKESHPFWDMMDRAERAGFLEEAIYVHLLDKDLLPGYLELREKQRERLVRYVETVLAPLPRRP